jgi:hypothetical protein
MQDLLRNFRALTSSDIKVVIVFAAASAEGNVPMPRLPQFRCAPAV